MNYLNSNIQKIKENTKQEIWKNVIPENNNFKITKHQEQKSLDSNNKFKVNQQIFSKTDIIGKGTQGTVQKVFNLNSMDQMACKCFSKFSMGKSIVVDKKFVRKSEIIEKEIFASGILLNDNLVNAYEVIDSPNSDTIYLIMELCDSDLGAFNNEQLTYDNNKFHGKSIFNLFTNMKIELNEEEIKDTQIQIFKGIVQLHSKNLAHCDIKPQNILIKNSIIKIADFGSLAQVFDDFHHNQDSGEGTEQFEPPEAYMRNQDKQKGDIWSLGVTLFIITFGYMPFDVEIKNQTMHPKNFVIRWNQATKKQYFTKDLKKFLQQILEPNQLKRPNIYDLINHIYLKNQEITETSNSSCLFCYSEVSKGDYQKLSLQSDNNNKSQISTNHMTIPPSDHDSNERKQKIYNRRTLETQIKNKSRSFNLDDDKNDQSQQYNVSIVKIPKLNQEYNQSESGTNAIVSTKLKNESGTNAIISNKLKLTNLYPSLVLNDTRPKINKLSIKMSVFGLKNSNFKNDHQTSIISKTISSKQRLNFESRKSDSNLLSLYELENKQNSKDALIYGCISQIGDLNLNLNKTSDQLSVNSYLENSFDIDDLIESDEI